jgi:hypothetical protein
MEHTADFALIGRKGIGIYINILAGDVSCKAHGSFPDIPDEGKAKAHLHFTQWTRAFRRKDDTYSSENYYVIREDGTIFYLKIGASVGLGTTITCGGRFDCPVDTAFTFLETTPSYRGPDYLVAAGASSHGELRQIGDQRLEDEAHRPIDRTRQEVLQAKLVQSLPNWARSLDMFVSDALGPSKDEGSIPFSSIFVVNGEAPRGTVTELCSAIDARLLGISDELPFHEITGLWVLDCIVPHGFFLIATFPTQTMISFLPENAEDSEEFGQDSCSLDQTCETVSLWAVESIGIIQMTRNSIYLVSLPSLTTICNPFNLVIGTTFNKACITPTQDMIIAIVRKGPASVLLLFRFGPDGINQTSGEVTLPINSTTLCVIHLANFIGAAVGTANGQLHIFPVTKEGLSSTSCVFDLNKCLSNFHSTTAKNHTQTREAISICESMIAIPSHLTTSTSIICGTRDGRLLHFRILIDESSSISIDTLHVSVFRIGFTAVKLFAGLPNIFAICGSGLYCINTIKNGSNISINTVRLTDFNRPDYRQGPVDTMTILSNQLWCVSKNRLLRAQLSRTTNTLTRRMHVQGNPQRAIYSKDFKKVMVITACKSETLLPVRGSVSEAIWKLQAIDPNEWDEPLTVVGGPDVTNGIIRRTIAEYDFEVGERALSLAEWKIEGSNQATFIVVGTGTGSIGKLLFFQLKKDSKESYGFRVAKSKICDGRVISMVDLGDNRICYCAGSNLYIEEFSQQEKR